MSQNANAKRLLYGFIGGMMGLGGLVILAWVVLWVVGALGGPQWQMPLKLLYSGGSLILTGLFLRWLATVQSGSRNT